MTDTWENVAADLHEVFRYRVNSRPQERAHEYLRAHDVTRSTGDTAMEAAALHMARRARELGRDEGTLTPKAVADGVADALEDYNEVLEEIYEVRSHALKAQRLLEGKGDAW